jgi:hypothetical protein
VATRDEVSGDTVRVFDDPDALPETADTTPGPDAPPTVWNRTAMMERMMGDESIAREIFETFLEEAARFRDPFDAAFDTALDTGDLRGLERLAHSTRGVAGCEAARVQFFPVSFLTNVDQETETDAWTRHEHKQ